MIDVEIRGLQKRFGDTTAVKEVNLEVKRGEFVALLGPSGCGKTTTLRMVAGFEQPDAGYIRIKGQDVTKLPPYRRDIGMVFQNYALFPHMTVFANVAYGLQRRKVPKDEIRERVMQALELVRLDGFHDRYPRQLSGGQQQRVAVARAIVIEPSVLLFDEPLSNLDAKLRLEMRSELRRLQQRLGISTIFVTHDQEEALAMADKVVVMKQGNIEQIGSPEDIYDRPRTLFVASFIGERNFIAGEIVDRQNGAAIVRCGRLQLRVAATDATLAPMTKGTISVRPEDMRLLGPDESPPADANVVTGHVKEIAYLGAYRQYRIVVDDGVELQLRSQGQKVKQLQENDQVSLVWDADAATFYPETVIA